MTREEAIDLLDNIIGFIEDNHGSDYDKALKIAIEALEQEPFMNKPCVSHKVCHEDKVKVLDKIRAEIEQTSETVDGFLMHDGTKRTVLKIINKHKSESEDKE